MGLKMYIQKKHMVKPRVQTPQLASQLFSFMVFFRKVNVLSQRFGFWCLPNCGTEGVHMGKQHPNS
jgi:hypothetical protein